MWWLFPSLPIISYTKKRIKSCEKFLQDFLFFKREKLVKSNPASTVIGITFVPITACEGEPSDPESAHRKRKNFKGFQGKFSLRSCAVKKAKF